MKGYKAFDKGFVCKGFQYEIGKTYKHEGELKICKSGFHFCEKLIDVFGYYDFDKKNVCLAEVEAIGDIQQEGTKFCTNEIKIIREVSWEEVDAKIIDGNHNSGNCNSGYCNSGNYNSGDHNSGDHNSGDCNSGYYNSGYCNSGYCNSGNHNSGNRNSGDYNSGYYNSGNHNSGNHNSGNHNSGYYNSGNYNSGFFNSDIPTVRLFNKDSGMAFYEIWELRINWEDLEQSKEIIKSLPNYDAQIFYEATGIDWREEAQ